MSRGIFMTVIVIGLLVCGAAIVNDMLSQQATANSVYSVKQNPIIVEPELLDEIVGEFSTPEDAPPVPVPDPETHLLPAPVLPEPSDSTASSEPVDLEAEYGPSVLVEEPVVRRNCRTYTRRTPIRNFIRRAFGR